MKAYGSKRIEGRESPELSDAKEFALPAHSVNLSGKGGDIRSNWKDSTDKRQARRYWKRQARSQGKMECINDNN